MERHKHQIRAKHLLMAKPTAPFVNAELCAEAVEHDLSILSYALERLPVGVEKLKTPYTGQMMGREYMSSILREIFFSEDLVVGADLSAFKTAIKAVEEEPALYGRACNVYSTYSGTDCGDTLIVGSSTAIMPVSTIVRQMNKLTTCEAFVDRLALMKSAATKIPNGLTQTGALAPMSRQIIASVFELFYRSRSAGPQELDSLEEFLGELKKNGASNDEQWRGLLQIVCEQPGWESV